MADLIPSGTKVQVSSTLPGSSRKALVADDDEAWTAMASPAHVAFGFPEPVAGAKRIALTFQGGFVATSVAISVRNEGEAEFKPLGKVYPEDKNARQVLDLPGPVEAITALRLDLDSSSDHHGRVTIYRVELLA